MSKSFRIIPNRHSLKPVNEPFDKWVDSKIARWLFMVFVAFITVNGVMQFAQAQSIGNGVSLVFAGLLILIAIQNARMDRKSRG